MRQAVELTTHVDKLLIDAMTVDLEIPQES